MMLAKTTMELLLEEEVECIELVRKLLIERDIGIITQETEDANEINSQVVLLRKRQNAVKKLIEREQMILDGENREDFISSITIVPNVF